MQGKKTTWETEIKKVMRHFCMKEEANRIIADVKANANGNESDELLYDRAWRRFKSILLN